MTGHAVFLCLLRRDPPDMRFVALTALHPHVFNMGLVFADVDYIFMTRETVPPVRSGGLVRFMTFIAVELHGRTLRPVYLYGPLNCLFIRLEMGDIEGAAGDEFFPVFFVAVAVETFLGTGSQIRCPVGMAVEARQFLHPCAMHFLALMASQAVPLFETELVRPVAVTFGTFDLFYKDMLCVVS